jgi:hypothetical protein
MSASMVRIPLEWGVVASAKLAGEEIDCSSNTAVDPPGHRQFVGVKRRKRVVQGMSAQVDSKNSTKSKKSESLVHHDNIAGVAQSIMQELNKSHIRSDAPCAEIDIDFTLSKIPYREMLRDLMDNHDVLALPDVVVVLRSYEENFMREPMSKGERCCVMDAECECMKIDPLNPFRGVEFLLPGEVEKDVAQMCVLCHRRFVQMLFHDVVYTGKAYRGVVQKYGSICGQPGEYAKEVNFEYESNNLISVHRLHKCFVCLFVVCLICT